MKYKVMDVKEFEKTLEKLARKYPSSLDKVEELFAELEEGVFSGDHVPNLRLKGNRIYKTRLENPDANKGKRGGFRVVWYLVTSENEIYPLTTLKTNKLILHLEKSYG
jgi:mRNA-degrading endonuclease RelE of RelBE toxin-antitoxin system